MRTVIVGCGRVGSSLARQLSEEGDEVTVVDFSEAAFNRLGEDFAGEMVFGSAVDEDILRRAGTDRAEAFVAVTNADTTNIMAAQLAQHEFGVKKVICRIYDPARADVYAELGLETICPTTIGAERSSASSRNSGRRPGVAVGYAGMNAYRFTQAVGIASIVLGLLILVRDLFQVHSIPYAIAGVGLLAFGAWRLQVAGRLRP